MHLNSAWSSSPLLAMDLAFIELDLSLYFINVYGLYIDRQYYWSSTAKISIFSSNRVVLGGDLNFTLRNSEFLGSLAKMNPLLDYMVSLFHQLNPSNILSIKITPTWSNNRTCLPRIEKRLDCFLI